MDIIRIDDEFLGLLPKLVEEMFARTIVISAKWFYYLSCIFKYSLSASCKIPEKLIFARSARSFSHIGIVNVFLLTCSHKNDDNTLYRNVQEKQCHHHLL